MPLLAAARLLLAQREAEVHQHRRALGGEDDVRGLDVAVDDAPRVGMAQRVEHGDGDPRRLLPGRAMVLHPAAEVGALEVIGDDIHGALVHADVVHRHDAGVAQLREPPRLLPRPFGVGPPWPAPARNTLMATGRSSWPSWPRYTAPKPPAPSRRRTS